MKNSKQALDLLRGIALLFCIVFAGQTAAADFIATGSMVTPRRLHATIPLADGKVLIAGGFSSVSGNLASAELYDPATGSFSATGSMTTIRSKPYAALLADGKVLIAGGEDGGGFLASAELYDPATGSFTATGSMISAHYNSTATRLANGKVLIAGLSLTGSPTSAELYDPATGSFSATGSMTALRYYHTATLLADGRVLLAGGADNFGFVASADLYDPATGSFSATGSMTASRYLQTATLLADGKVLVAGGFNSSSYLASAELYDPAAGSFTATGSMAVPRYFHTATPLPDGKVLIAGGQNTTGSLNSAERYDPAAGGFIATGNMVAFRVLHTAAPLADGRVLLTGGINPPVSAELYAPNQPPIANAGPDQNIYLGQTANLSGAASSDPEGTALTYTWALDSRPAGSVAGLSSTSGVSISLHPDVVGQYVISLVVNDGTLSSIADTVIVNVSQNLPPVAAASGTPTSGDAPLTVAFNAGASTDPEGGPLSYVWTFGDGSSIPATFVNPNHTYGSPGSYTAVVTVTDNFGNTDQASVLVTVTAPNMPPTAAPTATPSSGSAPLAVQFAAHAVDPEGGALTYAWSFGDGSPVSTLADPSHTYASAGTYTATLTVSDGTFSIARTLTISVGSALGIDVTEAKVEFGKPGKVDGKVNMKADFSFPGTPRGNVKVVFDGVTLLDVPFSRFRRERSGEYEYEAKNVHAEIDLARGKLKISRHKMLLTGIDNANGIDVVIAFGAAVGTDHFVMRERRHDHERSLFYQLHGKKHHGHEHDRRHGDRD